MYLTSCFTLSSEHLLVLTDTLSRSSLRHPPNRPDFRRTDLVKFQTDLEDQIPFHPELHTGMAIDVLRQLSQRRSEVSGGI